MQRVLLIIRGAIDEMAVARCYAEVPKDAAAIAICYELAPGRDGLQDGLAAQRSITGVLRQTWGSQAETIPVFAACDREGERVVDYATAWGATEVRG